MTDLIHKQLEQWEYTVQHLKMKELYTEADALDNAIAEIRNLLIERKIRTMALEIACNYFNSAWHSPETFMKEAKEAILRASFNE